MDGPIYISTDRTEKPHDLQMAVLDGGAKAVPPWISAFTSSLG